MEKTPKVWNAVEVRDFDCFNERRYSDPWAASLDRHGKVDTFCGQYDGGRRTGEGGTLWILGAKEGGFYRWGQRDNRGNNTTTGYVQIIGGKAVGCDLADVIKAGNAAANQ